MHGGQFYHETLNVAHGGIDSIDIIDPRRREGGGIDVVVERISILINMTTKWSIQRKYELRIIVYIDSLSNTNYTTYLH